MKKLILTALTAMTFFTQSSMAITVEQQQEALKQLELARVEISTVKGLIPGFLRKSINKNLESADERIAYAQHVLAITNVGSKFYCTVESSFEGQFSGKGNTELEASNNAMQACQVGSRNGGFFCKKNSLICQKEQ